MDCFASLAMTVSARRMGGAKRYPSVAVGEDDGFREGLNPSYRTTGLRTRGCGCGGHPAFATPSMGRKLNAQLGRIAPRGREVVSAVIASGAKRRSNPFFLYAARWIAP